MYFALYRIVKQMFVIKLERRRRGRMNSLTFKASGLSVATETTEEKLTR